MHIGRLSRALARVFLGVCRYALGGAPRRSSGDLGGLLSGVTDAIGGLFRGGLETEDLLLMLILYLMYRESGDKELLIVLGAMLLL